MQQEERHMKKLFLFGVAGIAAFHLVAALLVYRLTEPGTATTLVVAPAPAGVVMAARLAAGPPETVASPGVQAVLVRQVEPVIISGPSPAVVYSEPPVPMPEDPEARADTLEAVRQVRAIGPMQQLDARSAIRLAAMEARRAAMGLSAPSR
jgi:hypothetical protein